MLLPSSIMLLAGIQFRFCGAMRLETAWVRNRKVRPGGFEPPTCGLEVRCSIQLSYGRKRLSEYKPLLPFFDSSSCCPPALPADERPLQSMVERKVAVFWVCLSK